MEVTIRQETAGDREAVYEINSTAFGRENEAALVDRLRNSEAFIPELSLVAVTGDMIAGCILFTKITIVNDRNEETESLALAPVAVRPQFQHKGIGGQLIKYGLNCARNSGYKSVIVLGHKDYYPKFGFEPAAKWNIMPPFKLSETGGFMGIELATDALKNTGGVVKYPKAFEAV